MQLTDKHREYWNRNLSLTLTLLAVWFAVTFVLSYYARELTFNFLGWPFSFYMAAQGSLIVYIALIWFYARRMRQLDEQYGVEEAEDA